MGTGRALKDGGSRKHSDIWLRDQQCANQMPMTRPTPAALLLDLAELQADLTRSLDHALSPHGISFTEFSTLRQLYDAPRQCMRRVDLARSIGLSASGVTRLLIPMEKIGLVARQASERDARVSLVTLTRAGRRLFADADVAFEHFAADRLEALDAQERGELARLIGKLR